MWCSSNFFGTLWMGFEIFKPVINLRREFCGFFFVLNNSYKIRVFYKKCPSKLSFSCKNRFCKYGNIFKEGFSENCSSIKFCIYKQSFSFKANLMKLRVSME